jgi:hypothetical protein
VRHELHGTGAALAYRPDGSQLAVALVRDEGDEVQLLDGRGRRLRRLAVAPSPTQLSWSRDGARLLCPRPGSRAARP